MMIGHNHSGDLMGIVCPAGNENWLGGVHYLHHLVRSVNSLPESERLPFCDVWWGQPPTVDPFAEIRPLLLKQVVLSMPSTLRARLERQVFRITHGYKKCDLGDIFHKVGIKVLLPYLPVDNCGLPFIYAYVDFQYRHLPQYNPEVLWKEYESAMRKNFERATFILLYSEAVKEDMKRFFPEYVKKTRVIPICSVPNHEWWTKNPDQIAQECGLPDKFFMISNQFYSNKNHKTVFEATRILRDKGICVHVVCTGSPEGFHGTQVFDELKRWVLENGLDKQIHFMGIVSRADHMAMMRQSLAVLQPSLYEGWGFAMSDSKAIGKPVLASDIPVHHEHEHPSVFAYLAPLDVEAWAEAIRSAYQVFTPGPDVVAEQQANMLTVPYSQKAGRDFVALLRQTME